MTKNTLVEGAYPSVHKIRVSVARTGRRLSPATALIIVLLLSFGFWWAIWTAISSLVFG